METRRGAWALVVLIAALAVVGGCQDDAIESRQVFNRVELVLGGDAALAAAPTAALEAEAVAMIDGAERTVDAAFEHLESAAVAEALVRADGRGVRVRVIGDEDHRDQVGFRTLVGALGESAAGSEGAAGAVRFGDGALTYSPRPTSTLTRRGDLNRMTHNFVIVDERALLWLSGGFWAAEGDGQGLAEVAQVGLRVTSEDLPRDFGDEFEQMYGGVYATTLSAFNGPLKSDSNPRFNYPTTSGDLEVYFGPQERPLKRVVDDLYNARSTIYIATEAFTNETLANALAYKVATGFNVVVIVDREGLAAGGSQMTNLFRLFAQVPRVIGPTAADNVAEVRVADGVRETLVLLDPDRSATGEAVGGRLGSPIDGALYRTRAMVMSAPIVENFPFVRAGADGGPDVQDGLAPRASDVFNDSTLWVMTEGAGEDREEVQALLDHFIALYGRSEPYTLPAP